jgi:hypothetical protein
MLLGFWAGFLTSSTNPNEPVYWVLDLHSQLPLNQSNELWTGFLTSSTNSHWTNLMNQWKLQRWGSSSLACWLSNVTRNGFTKCIWNLGFLRLKYPLECIMQKVRGLQLIIQIKVLTIYIFVTSCEKLIYYGYLIPFLTVIFSTTLMQTMYSVCLDCKKWNCTTTT